MNELHIWEAVAALNNNVHGTMNDEILRLSTDHNRQGSQTKNLAFFGFHLVAISSVSWRSFRYEFGSLYIVESTIHRFQSPVGCWTRNTQHETESSTFGIVAHYVNIGSSIKSCPIKLETKCKKKWRRSCRLMKTWHTYNNNVVNLFARKIDSKSAFL